MIVVVDVLGCAMLTHRPGFMYQHELHVSTFGVGPVTEGDDSSMPGSSYEYKTSEPQLLQIRLE
jgi:hypothetical protein